MEEVRRRLPLRSMIYVGLAIMMNAVLAWIFRSYQRFGVQTFGAIVVNYFTCVATAWVAQGAFPLGPDPLNSTWGWWAAVLGTVFISGFYLTAVTIQQVGVATASVFQRMSLLLTVLVAVWFFGETWNVAKIAGLVLALLAVLLVNYVPGDQKGVGWSRWLLPALVLLLSACVEVGLQYGQRNLLDSAADEPRFVTGIFLSAGILGLFFLLVWGKRKGLRLGVPELVGGLVLGIPNYFSIYFIVAALGTGLGGSVVYPMVNVGSILLATGGAVLFFKERLSGLNWLGLGLALAAILAMGYA